MGGGGSAPAPAPAAVTTTASTTTTTTVATPVSVLVQMRIVDTPTCAGSSLNVSDTAVHKLSTGACFVLVNYTTLSIMDAYAHCFDQYNGHLASGHTKERWDTMWSLLEANIQGEWMGVPMLQESDNDLAGDVDTGWYWVTPYRNWTVSQSFLLEQNFSTLVGDAGERVGKFRMQSGNRTFADETELFETHFICEFMPEVLAPCFDVQALVNETLIEDSKWQSRLANYQQMPGNFEGTTMLLEATHGIPNRKACILKCTHHILCRSLSYNARSKICQLHYTQATHRCFRKIPDVNFVLFNRIL